MNVRLRSVLLPFALAPLLVAMVAPPLACSAPCAQVTHYYTGGQTIQTDTLIRYETSPDAGPFLPFQGGAALHLRHEMGVRPQTIQIYLSFNQYPFQENAGGYSQAAGNQAIVLGADEQEVLVKNDSCSAYWIRVVLTGVPASLTDAGPG